ncbi:DNA excision repair protein ERCC-5 isoform X2 [Periplaneta americana]
MSRLLKRRSVQVSLEDAEKEMGGRSLSLGELEELLSEQGVVTESKAGMRIASDETTRYLYVKDIGKQILAKTKTETSDNKPKVSSPIKNEENNEPPKIEDDCNKYMEEVSEFIYQEEEDLERNWTSNSDEDLAPDQEKIESKNMNLKMAQNFIFENSGLTQEQILAVIQYQNAVESENQQSSEHFVAPDQPSTSGISGYKAKRVEDSNTPGCSGTQEHSIQNKRFSVAETTSTTSKVNVNNTNTGVTEKTFTIETDSNKDSISLQLNSSKMGADIVAKNTSTEEIMDNIVSNENKADSIKSLNTLTIVEKSNHLEKFSDDRNSCSLRQDQGAESNKTASDNNISSGSMTVAKNRDTISDKENEQLKSDSDSESEFVEVMNENTLPHENKSFVGPKSTVEVLIQPDKRAEIEDDIFADIFATETKETTYSKIKTALENVSDSSTVRDTRKNIDLDSSKSVIYSEGIKNKANDFKRTDSLIKNVDSNRKMNIVNEVESTEKSSAASEIKLNSNIETVEDKLELDKRPSSETGGSSKNLPPSTVSSEDLKKLQMSLEEKHQDLLVERGKQERLAANITDQMCMEAQELLQLFGVPYIVAPMEAEAQCAFLDLISLTDGTITDDSDIWLFGGQKVYKNFFNQKKHVMHYKAADIKHYFKLERKQMILLALLVGSDYTPGLQGVGPVTALEILAAFPTNGEETNEILKGLQNFRVWWNNGMTVGPGRTPLKNKLRDLQFVEGFPSVAVVDAYLHPKVDESRETFSWGLPDLTSLRDFAQRKFGWSRSKTDEILLPIMKKLEERKNQMSLDSYFKVIPKLQAAEGKLSKRVKKAVHRLGKGTSSDSEESITENRHSTQSKKRRIVTNVDNRQEGVETEQGRGRVRGRGRGRGSGRGSVQVSVTPATEPRVPIAEESISGEFIPQRERDKINALKSKLKAIEVFRTSKTGLDRTKRQKRIKRQILKEAKLSESSSSSE